MEMLRLEDDIDLLEDEKQFIYKDKKVPMSAVKDTIHRIESDRGKNAKPRYEPQYHKSLKEKYQSGEWTPTPAERRVIAERGEEEALKQFSTSVGEYQIMPETAYRYTSFAGNPEDLQDKKIGSDIANELLERSHKKNSGDLESSVHDWNQLDHYLPRFKKFIKEKGFELNKLNPFAATEASASELPKLQLEDDIGLLNLVDDIGIMEERPKSALEVKSRFNRSLKDLNKGLDSGQINAEQYAVERQSAKEKHDRGMAVIDERLKSLGEMAGEVPDLEDRVTRDILNKLSPQLGTAVSSFLRPTKGAVQQLVTGKPYLSDKDEELQREHPVVSTGASVAGGIIPYALAASTGLGLPVAFGGVAGLSELAEVRAREDLKQLNLLQKTGRVGVATAGGAFLGKFFKDARLLPTVIGRVGTGATAAGGISFTESLIKNGISGEDLDWKTALANGALSFATIFALGALIEIPAMHRLIIREAEGISGKKGLNLKQSRKILNDAQIPEHKLSPAWQEANREVQVATAIKEYQQRGISAKDAKVLMGRSTVRQRSDILERSIGKYVERASQIKKSNPKLADTYLERGSQLARYKKMIVEEGVDPAQVFLAEAVAKKVKTTTQVEKVIQKPVVEKPVVEKSIVEKVKVPKKGKVVKPSGKATQRAYDVDDVISETVSEGERVVEVPYERFHFGRYEGSKKLDEGDISRSASSGSLTNDKIGRPFMFEGNMYVATGDAFAKGIDADEKKEAYRLVPKSEYKGKTHIYRTKNAEEAQQLFPLR